MKTTNLMPMRKRKITGLGDVVHALVNPVAKAIDAVAGTQIQECVGCAKRRARLNRLVPLK